METTYHASPPSYSRLYDEHLVQPSGQQQQQAVVVMSADRPVINQPPPLVQSFSGHMVLACIVFWCCGWLFGMIAFILAVVAQNYSTSLNVHDRETARQYGKASIILSVIGLIVGVLAYVLILCMVVLGAAAAVVECPYPIDGQCYKHRSMESVADCILKMGHYVSPYCYYN